MLKKLKHLFIFILFSPLIVYAMDVKVETPLLIATIHTESGNIKDITLKNYKSKSTKDGLYHVIGQGKIDVKSAYFIHQNIDVKPYAFVEQHQVANAPYTKLILSNSPFTPTLTRTYTFSHNNYEISVTDTFRNNTKTPLSIAYESILTNPSTNTKSNFISAYKGFLYLDSENSIYKKTDKYLSSNPIVPVTDPKWMAYSDTFFTVILSQKAKSNQIQSINNQDSISLRSVTPLVTLNVGDSATYKTDFYIGPIVPSYISSLTSIHNPDAVLDYGFLSTLSKLFFKGLDFINSFAHNYGLSIVLLTVFIRFLLYPVQLKVNRTNDILKKIQPEIEAIKTEYTPKQSSILVKELLKERGINPSLSLLLPIFQLPIFIGFLWMLVSNSDLREAGLFLWVSDLSIPDPYMVLPLIYSVLLYFQNKPIAKETKNEIFAFAMYIMPIPAFFVFSYLPAGIVLYVITNTVFSLILKKIT